MKHFVLILALLLCAAATAHAQSPVITRSTEMVTDDNGRRFYVHTVQQGETLYSLCRAYSIELPALMRLNPALHAGLKTGQKLKIPVANDSAMKPLFAPSSAQAGSKALTIEHVVKRRETLFSISNLYDVSIADIKQHNPQSFANDSDKLKRGQTLYIPIGLSGVKSDTGNAAAQAAADNIPFECDGATYTLPINVALLLPFDTQNFDDRDSYNSFRFVEMYEGALIALESLRQQGVSVNLTVLDSRSATPETIMLNPALSSADIIIGPVYPESFKTIAEFAKSRNIRIVSPLTPIDTALSTYTNVFQVPTGFDEQVNQSMTHSHFDPVQSNVVLVWERDNETSKTLRRKYRSYLPPSDSTFYRNLVMSRDSTTMERLYYEYLILQHKPTVKNLAYKVGFQPRDNQGTLLKIFHPTLENKVIVASQDEPFVSELLANLKAFSDRYKCNITVYGTASWQKFENVEHKLYYDLKLHLATPYYVDYSREAVKDFVRSFRGQYKTEPSQYAFQGHDVILYFVSAIAQFGKKFEPCLPLHHVELLQSRYDFGRTKPKGAYSNSGVFLLRYTPWMDITTYE